MAGGGGGHQALVCRGSTTALAECSRAELPFPSWDSRPIRSAGRGETSVPGFFLLILKEWTPQALPRPTQLHTGVPLPPPSGPPGKGPRPGEVMPAPCGVVSRCIPEGAAPGPGALLPRAQTSLAWLAGHTPHRAQEERKKGPGPGPCDTLSSCPWAVALVQKVGWARARRAVRAAPCPKSTDM